MKRKWSKIKYFNFFVKIVLMRFNVGAHTFESFLFRTEAFYSIFVSLDRSLMIHLYFSVVEYVDSFSYNYRNKVESDSEEDNSEDEDSNDENNWRNDYPDEDEFDESVDEDDMRRAMEDFDLDGNRELSSDDSNFGEAEEEKSNGFVYSIDSEAIGFEDDLDYCDVNRYGEAYARYKKRILKNAHRDYLPESYFKDDEDDDKENYSD